VEVLAAFLVSLSFSSPRADPRVAQARTLKINSRYLVSRLSRVCV